jgi:dTDP-glucose pyrophosphorylase
MKVVILAGGLGTRLREETDYRLKPMGVRYVLSQVIAATIYYPLARLSWLLERVGVKIDALPLSAYRAQSF